MDLLYTVVAEAVNQPVSVADCKLDLKIESDFTDDDDLISAYIDAAGKLCSEITGKKLISESIQASFQCVDENYNIRLPHTPVQAITEIQYYDGDNVSQTLDVTDFHLYNFENHSMLVPKADVSWPGYYSRRDAINVTYTAGYGDNSTDLPATIRKAIRLTVAHWYENRTAVLVGVTAQDLPFGVEMLLGTERVGWVA